MVVKLGRTMWAPFERFSQLVKCAAFPGKERVGATTSQPKIFPILQHSSTGLTERGTDKKLKWHSSVILANVYDHVTTPTIKI